ncbi:SART-1 protein [Dunaliella salina]|uniref:SART-1 protein n=1 Tax=Dunaliella salina TaxID=3046 RepID=A0ABQ7GQM1_DUNSA|nr:SART-1 protein [Dunaliella salina]|eukprot:KAF5836904.1 SART-1 protein [Dunaliella salina]
MADHGGEEAVSMSIAETNKLRASLGLKPLKETPNEDAAMRKREEERREQREKEERAEAFKAKQAEKKNRQSQSSFLNTRTLGEDDSIDDTLSWVERSRQAEARLKAEKEQEQRRKEAEERKRRDQMDEDEEPGYSAAELAGMKVKHDYNEINEGESVVLTLADKALLARKGLTVEENDDDNDELENVLKAEERKRQKARSNATNKAKPLWEEDGKKRSLLDKYDEEDADISLQIGADGSIEAERAAQQQAEMKRKLQQGGKQLESAAVGALGQDEPTFASDYKTEAEVGGFKKKTKKPKKRLRAKSAEPEEEGNTAGLIEALEAEAEARQGSGAGGESRELGSRAAREEATRRTERAATAEAAAKRERFEAAVAKSNWASEALRPQQQESLARARRLAAQQAEKRTAPEGKEEANGEGKKAGSSLEEIAEESRKKREKDEAEYKEQMKAGLLVNDTIEFVRNIQVKAETKAEAAANAAPGQASVVGGKRPGAPPPPPPEAYDGGKDNDGDDYMGLSTADREGTASARRSSSPPPKRHKGTGRWVSAQDAEGTASVQLPSEEREEQQQQQQRQLRQKREPTPDETPTGERAVGKGLAGALALLKEKGNVGSHNITWAGRNTDKSKNALQGLGDVYRGGAHEDRLARSIEMALTTKDEFGQVMTPKERFRQLCYEFHGKAPSKNKQEIRLQKAAEEIARRKNATSEIAQHQEVEGLRKATEKTHQPYVVLQGKGAAETLKAATAAGSEKAKIPPPPPPGSSGAAGMRRVGGGSAKGGGAAGGKVTDMRPPSGVPPQLRKTPAPQ